jgi:hypothetical protein
MESGNESTATARYCGLKIGGISELIRLWQCGHTSRGGNTAVEQCIHTSPANLYRCSCPLQSLGAVSILL